MTEIFLSIPSMGRPPIDGDPVPRPYCPDEVVSGHLHARPEPDEGHTAFHDRSHSAKKKRLGNRKRRVVQAGGGWQADDLS